MRLSADELRVLAERLNPDAWVTDGEVRQGLESFERVLETVRQRLGRPRRRRAPPGPDPPLPGAAANSVDDSFRAALRGRRPPPLH